MSDLPRGTVTFLFTDIEGSTRLLQQLGDRYPEALAAHRRIVRDALASHAGVEVDTQGDAFFAAFPDAIGAVAAAREAQAKLAAGPIRVRMGLHTGQPIVTAEGYVGLDVHMGARIAACGHGGQVLLSEATRRLVDVDVRDLGMHRLKDLPTPERIYQLGNAEFPPLKSLYLFNLPVQPTPFLGRERELAEVVDLLRRPNVRVLTLTGPGGSGKTRLSLQAAAELRDEYRDGVWFVGLAAITQPGLLAGTVATTLGLREAAGETFDDALANHLRDRRIMIVLDNVEQLLPDAALTIAALSAGAPNLDLVVASREPLRVAGEHEYPVPPLLPDEAVALFGERAQATRSDFVVTDENRPAIEAICARVDRLPLAIELAAARVKLLPPKRLLDRLEQRLPMLVGGARDAPDRQRTLRATIAWSYDLLSEQEQHLFARMAVFNGGSSLEGAESVCDADVDTLSSLIDKSLLRAEAGPGGEPRYLMLETIREYALERLGERSDAADTRRSHAAHILALAEQAEPGLKGREQSAWLERLEAEHDNIRSALSWSLEEGDPEDALRTAATLWNFWYTHGHVTEGRRWLAGALERTEPRATVARATALDGAAYLAAEQGDPRWQDMMATALRCARDVGSPVEIAIAASHISTKMPIEKLAEALALGEEAVSVARESNDPYTLAVTLNNLGEVMRMAGDYERTTALYEESYVLRLQIGDRSRIALSTVNLGEMAFLAGDTARARSMFSEALEMATGIGDKRQMCFALEDLGWVALREGLDEEAARCFRESLILCLELGHRGLSLESLSGLVGVAAKRGDLERAGRLAGAVTALERVFARATTTIDSHESHAARLAEVRAECESSGWERAWKEGTAMTLDAAIAYAIR